MPKFTAELIAAVPYTYGCRGRNEAFIDNCMGQTIEFDIQPYENGRGEIVAITSREVKTTKHDPQNGTMSVVYECYDLEVQVTSGSRVGAFICGRPVCPAKPTDGTVRQVTGVTYGELSRACFHGERIVIATCG